MNRQNYQQIGFIIVLVVAGISLPTSIISLTREPTIINNNYYYDTYYNQSYYYYYYNQSYYGDNETEPDYSQPFRMSIRNNTFAGHMQIRTYEVSSGYMYRWFFNSTGYNFGYWSQHATFQIYVVGDSWLSIFLGGYFAIAHTNIYIGNHRNNGYFSVPYYDIWHFIVYQEDDTMYGGIDIVPSNYTIMDEILKI